MSDEYQFLRDMKSNMESEKDNKNLRIPIIGVMGEYYYSNFIGKLEVQEISFNGIYVKIPQVMVEGQEMEIRFSLAPHSEIFWSPVIVSKVSENSVFLEFVNIPTRSKNKITLFIDEIATKNALKSLQKKP